MHKLTAILATLALSTTALAAPRRQNQSRKAAAKEHAVLLCVDERTGPTDGLELEEAFRLCRAIARHDAKVAKLAKQAAQARASGITRLAARLEWECAEEISIACEDTAVRSEDGGECSDATLESKHAFDVCRGTKGGK